MTEEEATNQMESEQRRNRLLAEGYTREKCKTCNGDGGGFFPGQLKCQTCKGEGYTWQAPIRS